MGTVSLTDFAAAYLYAEDDEDPFSLQWALSKTPGEDK